MDIKYISNKQLAKSDTIRGGDVILENVKLAENIKVVIQKRNKTVLKSKVLIPQNALLKIEALNDSILNN